MDEFRRAVEKHQETLNKELNRDITFEVIDKDRIAELYATYIGRGVEGASGPLNMPSRREPNDGMWLLAPFGS
jgi:hypothetical protein